MLLQMYEGIFGCKKFDSVTSMLFAVGLTSCETMMHNAKMIFCWNFEVVHNNVVNVFFTMLNDCYIVLDVIPLFRFLIMSA